MISRLLWWTFSSINSQSTPCWQPIKIPLTRVDQWPAVASLIAMGALAVSILTLERVLQTLSILFCCYPFGESPCYECLIVLLLEGQTKRETSLFYKSVLQSLPSSCVLATQYELWLIRLAQVTINTRVITTQHHNMSRTTTHTTKSF